MSIGRPLIYLVMIALRRVDISNFLSKSFHISDSQICAQPTGRHLPSYLLLDVKKQFNSGELSYNVFMAILTTTNLDSTITYGTATSGVADIKQY